MNIKLETRHSIAELIVTDGGATIREDISHCEIVEKYIDEQGKSRTKYKYSINDEYISLFLNIADDMHRFNGGDKESFFKKFMEVMDISREKVLELLEDED